MKREAGYWSCPKPRAGGPKKIAGTDYVLIADTAITDLISFAVGGGDRSDETPISFAVGGGDWSEKTTDQGVFVPREKSSGTSGNPSQSDTPREGRFRAVRGPHHGQRNQILFPTALV